MSRGDPSKLPCACGRTHPVHAMDEVKTKSCLTCGYSLPRSLPIKNVAGKLKSWREMLPLAMAVLKRSISGCCWHLVLGDSNFDLSSAEFCAKTAQERGHPECIALIDPMLRASQTQRGKLHSESMRAYDAAADKNALAGGDWKL